MNTSTSYSKGSSEVHHRSRDQMGDDYVTLNENVNLTKKQYEVLKIVCDTYQKSIPEYMQDALIEAMRTDIEEGTFCDALLDKLGGEHQEEDKRVNTCSPVFINDDISSLQF